VLHLQNEQLGPLSTYGRLEIGVQIQKHLDIARKRIISHTY
jgi:hypothetical protein